MVIKNAKIITPEKITDDADILIEGGTIQSIGRDLSDTDTLDAKGMYLTPGFVDIHTHGGYGADFMDSTPEAFSDALRFHLDNGTTSVVATSCTAPRESIISFLDFTREYLRSGARESRLIAGVHLEGPYLSKRNRGAQKEEDLAIPDKDDYSYILNYADIIRTVTLSPELPGADKMTRALTDVGIVVSGGHDDGIYPEFMPAIGAGMSHLTHLYCAMSELRFKDGRRNVGLREYALTDDSLTAEIIADDRHIPPELARLIIRAKGADRVAVVSDSLRCAGFEKDDRLYKLGSGDDAQLFRIGDGVAVTADGTKYAGSITPVRAMVKNLIDAGIGIVDAVKTGTLTPARIIGKGKEIGSIEVGKRANICILNANFELIDLILDGNIIQKGK
ncbi:MAG: N-acetylglucosamine-6-phosphate deacetylase [Clostridia bacterium]|nr:N-acetylglucosamine-6-phosphate deacetylase [Clostridia bacterium]